MARARNIKPALFNNDELADNDPLGRLLFIGLWTLADFNGNLIWKARRVKAQLLPYDDCDIQKLAINLDKSGFIRFYSDGDNTYCSVVNFSTHQNPHLNEKKKGSDIPKYSEEMRQALDLKGLTINRDKSGLKRNNSESDPADSLILIPDSLSLNPDSLITSISIDDLFGQFWCAGMRKVNKQSAVKAFNKVIKKQSDQQDFTDRLVFDVQQRLQAGQLGFAEMHPTSYLNAERWTDEAPRAPATPQQNQESARQAELERLDREAFTGNTYSGEAIPQRGQDLIGDGR